MTPSASPRSGGRSAKRKLMLATVGIVAGMLGGVSQNARATDLDTITSRVTSQLLASVPSSSTVNSEMSSLQANGSWADVNYADTSSTNWAPMTHLSRMQDMAKDWSSLGSSLYHNATLGTDLTNAYNYWISRNPQSGNWWYNDIGSLQTLGNIMVLYHASLTTTQLNSGLSFLSRASAAIPTYGTGQNMVDLAIVGIDQGIAAQASATVATAYANIGGTVNVTLGSGIQPDSSHLFHGPQLYYGGYGILYVNDLLNESTLATGTSYAMTTSQEHTVINALLDGAQWMVRGRAQDITSAGRDNTRVNVMATEGSGYVSATQNALTLGTYRQSELQSFLGRQQEAISTGAASSTTNVLSGNRNFFDADLMVQERANYYMSVKISSTRTAQPESGNSEGLENLYLGDGVNQIMMTGTEYANIEPVWNWRMLPGTTVEQDTRSLKPTADWGVLGTSKYAGGVSDGTYGAEAFNYKRYDVAAQKFWSFFDNEEVAIGAGITSSNTSYPVYTTINQTLLSGTISYETTTGGITNISTGAVTPANLKWVYHDGVGYFFTSPVSNATIQAISQTGNWYKINTTQTNANVSANVFTLYENHGKAVSAGSYGYIVVPNMTASGMDAYAAANPIQILANTTNVQAVRQSALDITQAAFYNASSFTLSAGQTVAMNHPSMLMLQRATNSIKLSASNPQNAQLNVAATLTGVTLSGSGSSWFDQMGTGTANFNCPGGNLAGSTVGFTMASDGAASPTVSLISNEMVSNYSYVVNQAVALSANTTFSPDALGTLTFASSVTGAFGLSKSGPGILTFNHSNSYAGGTNVSGGRLQLGVAGALPVGGSLNIGSGASVVAMTLTTKTAVQVGTLNDAGLFDLTNNGLVVHSGSLSAISSLVASGYHAGGWNGTTGIVSSTAATNAKHLTALGTILNDNVGRPLYGSSGTIAGTFNGVVPVDGDILLKYTYYGDANLDGQVTSADYTKIDNGFLNSSSGWANGDFNYDNIVNGSDYTLIDNAFNTQGASLLSIAASPTAEPTNQMGAVSIVPEPTALCMLATGMVGLLGRRKRATVRERAAYR